MIPNITSTSAGQRLVEIMARGAIKQMRALGLLKEGDELTNDKFQKLVKIARESGKLGAIVFDGDTELLREMESLQQTATEEDVDVLRIVTEARVCQRPHVLEAAKRILEKEQEQILNQPA